MNTNEARNIGSDNSAPDYVANEFSSSDEGMNSNSQSPSQNQQEKTFKQSEVGSLLNRARREERERVKQELAQERAQSERERQQPTTPPAPPLAANNGQAQPPQAGQTGPSVEDITRISNEQIKRAQDEAVATAIANEFNAKMERGKDKYPDFEEKVADLNLQGMLPVVQWANSMDNTADIMYEFASQPEKLAAIMNLAYTNQPQLAYKKLQSLSASIKANEAAKNTPSARSPLNQLNASNLSTDSGGDLSDVSSLMKQPWLKG